MKNVLPPTRTGVGNPLLSERDGNNCFTVRLLIPQHLSETHYSLKEMETSLMKNVLPPTRTGVGNPLLSERDGNLVPSL